MTPSDVASGQAERVLAAELATAFAELLASLPAERRTACLFEFADPRRRRWDGGPGERPGVQLRELPPESRHLAIAMVAHAHSPHGLRTVLRTWALEAVLRDAEGGSAHRHPERYWLQLYGDPAAGRCGLRLEGHHCSINLTVDAGRVRATPLFRASNPARVASGPHAGLRVLGREEDAGRAAALALSAAERAAADADPEPCMDLLTGSGPTIGPLPPGGIELAALAPVARVAVECALDAWIDHLAPTLAAGLRARLAPRRERLRFAWTGATAAAAAHSWRIVGEGLVLEFAKAQNAGNHIHAVLREPDGDFADTTPA